MRYDAMMTFLLMIVATILLTICLIALAYAFWHERDKLRQENRRITANVGKAALEASRISSELAYLKASLESAPVETKAVKKRPRTMSDAIREAEEDSANPLKRL